MGETTYFSLRLGAILPLRAAMHKVRRGIGCKSSLVMNFDERGFEMLNMIG